MMTAELGQEVAPYWAVPVHLEVAQPVSRLDQHGPFAHGGVGDPYAVLRSAESDLLTERSRRHASRVHAGAQLRPGAAHLPSRRTPLLEPALGGFEFFVRFSVAPGIDEQPQQRAMGRLVERIELRQLSCVDERRGGIT